MCVCVCLCADTDHYLPNSGLRPQDLMMCSSPPTPRIVTSQLNRTVKLGHFSSPRFPQSLDDVGGGSGFSDI